MNHFIPGLIACLFSGFVLAADIPVAPSVSKSSLVGSYQIRNLKFGDLLRPKDANGAVGTPIVLYSAQPWKCMTWKLHSVGEATYQLQNHFTSKTFAPDGAAQQAQQRVTQVIFSEQTNENQSWQFTRLADGVYRIADVKSGKTLTAIKDKDGFEPKVVVQDWQDREEQKWRLTPIDPKQLTM